MKKVKTKTKLRDNPGCNSCPATCCHDLAMMVNKPRTEAEIEDLAWHIQYDTVNIFIRNHRWYLLIKGKCIYLSRNKLCKIYKDRPDKCRRHQPPDCEHYGEYHDAIISTPEELRNYLSKKKKKKSRR